MTRLSVNESCIGCSCSCSGSGSSSCIIINLHHDQREREEGLFRVSHFYSRSAFLIGDRETSVAQLQVRSPSPGARLDSNLAPLEKIAAPNRSIAINGAKTT